MTPNPADTPPSRAERLTLWSVLAFAAAGMVLLLFRPQALLLGFGLPGMPAAVHLFTLGVLLGVHHALHQRALTRVYGRVPAWRWAPHGVWLLHFWGVVFLAAGFYLPNTLLQYIGGHYLISTGIVLAFVQGVVTALRRPRGVPVHPAAHLPGVGLLVVMSLGAMLVLDAYAGGYNLYTPQTIAVHLAAGHSCSFCRPCCCTTWSTSWTRTPSRTCAPSCCPCCPPR